MKLAVYERLDDVPASLWDEVRPADFYFARAFLDVMQRSAVENAQYRYLVALQGHAPAALAVVTSFTLKLDLLSNDPFTRLARRWLPGVMDVPIVCCGVPASYGQYHLHLVRDGFAAESVRQVHRFMDDWAAQQRCSMLFWKEWNPGQPAHAAVLDTGYVSLPTLPDHRILRLDREPAAFLARLRSSYRRKYRSAAALVQGSGPVWEAGSYRLERGSFDASRVADFYQGYSSVMERATVRLETYPAAFFALLAASDTGAFTLRLTHTTTGEYIEALMYPSGDVLTFGLISKHRARYRAALYPMLLQCMVLYGIRAGFRELRLGQTSAYAKCTAGAEPWRLETMVLVRRLWRHRLLGRFGSRLFPEVPSPGLNVFREVTRGAATLLEGAATRIHAVPAQAGGVRGADRLADELIAAGGGTVEAILFYGSHLNGAGPGPDSAVDFIVVVTAYAAFYRALRNAGALHRSVATLSLLSSVLPPTSIAFRRADNGCAKCVVVSHADFETAVGPRRRDHLLVARLVQQVELLHARDPEAAGWIENRIAEARGGIFRWLAPFLDETFDAQDAARRMLQVCYRSELRPEAVDRAEVVFARQREFLCRELTELLNRAAENRTVTPVEGAGRFRLARSVSRWERMRVRRYLAWSNARTTMRWFKHVITFDGWLPYIAAKVERRTGQRVELSERERRWPALFLWPRVIRTLRTRPLHEGQAVRRVASVAQTIAFLRDPAGFMAGAGLGLGDLYRVRVPGHRLHVVTDPRLVEEILVRHADCFEKSGIYWAELRRRFGASMGSLEGDAWQRLHTEQSPFFTPRAVKDYMPAVQDITESELERLAVHLGAASEHSAVGLFAELNARIVLHLLFGRVQEPAALDIANRIADAHALIAWNTKYPWRPLVSRVTGRARRGRSHAAFFRRYAEMLSRSDAARDPQRLLHALVRLHECGGDAAFPTDLVANEVTFHLGASTETQAAAEAWAVYLLWQHPDVLRRVRDEIDRVTNGSAVGVSHLASLCLCRNVVLETLRLYPPVYAILRDCVRPVHLSGHAARQGESFAISLYGLHRNPRLWDQPERFAPERFEHESASEVGKYQYLPFGHGKHVCIGQHLALPSMVLVIAMFAQRFDWQFTTPARPVAEPSLKPAATVKLSMRKRTPGRMA